jgi:hypothetical protein
MKLKQFAAALKELLKNHEGFCSVEYSDNIWDSVTLRITKEKKEDWPRGIYYNANYCVLLVGGDAQREENSKQYVITKPVSNWLKVRAKTDSLEAILAYLTKKFKEFDVKVS